MKKALARLLCLSALLTVSVFSFTQSETAIAAKTIQENKNEVSRLENTLSSKQDDIAYIQAQIDEAKRNVQSQANVKSLLDKQIEDIQDQIEITKQLIDEYNVQIDAKKEEIVVVDSNISDALTLIKERLIVQHETGNSSMIAFILGSNSFEELLTRIEITSELFEYDQEIINKLSHDREVLASAQNELEELLKKCEDTENELSSTESELEVKVTDATAYLNTLKQDEKYLENAKAKKEQELVEIQNIIKALLREIENQEREDYSSDEFRFPFSYDTWYVNTGGYGWRVWNSGRATDFHKGVDFAAAYGTPILAVNSGYVTNSYYSNSFGNCIIIDHGGGIFSLYAHASKRLVSAGEIVTKGQEIAKVGSTGDSTGNHLHFAILKNGEYVDPMNYISEP